MPTDERTPDAPPPPELAPTVVGAAPRVARRTIAEALGVVAFVAVGVGLLGGHVLAIASGTVALLAGVGCAVLGGTVVGIVQIAIDPERGVARLATSDGGEVDVPLDAIDRAEAASHIVQRKGGSRTVWKLTLHKRDGGVLDTNVASDEAGVRRAAGALEVALAAARSTGAAPTPAAQEVLTDLRRRRALRVEVAERRGGSYRSGPSAGSVAVAWSAATPWVQTAIAVGLIGAFWQIARGVAASEDHAAATVVSWVLAALTAVPIVLFGMSAGVQVRVEVDDEGLTVERRRFGQPFASRRYALAEVEAIDLSVVSHLITLVVRAAGDEPLPEVDETDGVVHLASAIARHASRPGQLPIGGLTLADGLHLDLALSAELARRKGVAPGTV